VAKFQTAICKSILIKCNTHRCTLGDIKGTVLVGILFNDLGDILGVSTILAGHCYAGDNAVLQGQDGHFRHNKVLFVPCQLILILLDSSGQGLLAGLLGGNAELVLGLTVPQIDFQAAFRHRLILAVFVLVFDLAVLVTEVDECLTQLGIIIGGNLYSKVLALALFDDGILQALDGHSGVVSGGITVLCRHIHIIAHGESDAFCLVVLTCGQGELAGRPTVKHFAIGHCGLVQRHGHCCAVRYRVGLLAGGCVSFAVQLAGHIAAVVFHSNSAAGHGQRVAARSIGVELPTGIEGDVLRNCGIVHIKGLAIFGVPAGELVTRTGGIIDGSQFVCLGISDFFGLINRHLIVAGQAAALGIKGHLAEVKKIAIFKYIIAWKLFCVVPVVVVVDGTNGVNGVSVIVPFTSSRTTNQTVSERSQSSREHNGFQLVATSKGIIADRRNIFT